MCAFTSSLAGKVCCPKCKTSDPPPQSTSHVQKRSRKNLFPILAYQIDSELPAISVDFVRLGVADGGEVDGLGGVEAAGVDHKLQRLQRQRRVLPLGAERVGGWSEGVSERHPHSPGSPQPTPA